MRLLPAFERLALTLWVGGLCAIGYIAAPALFIIVDDRALAGAVADRLFGLMSYVGLVCGVGLLGAWWWRREARGRGAWRLWAVGTMLALTLIAEFGLSARMDTLDAAGAAFERLHHAVAALFVAETLLGLGLVLAPPASPR
ncbi:MAG: DUF4149 domain-containing protein [Gammaproteobacteria bacterium]|nr:DUF4149 domain-containing protein [Gammaproteobacteria bacterium]